MSDKGKKETKMYIYVADVVFVVWNNERGQLLKRLRGKKSRQKLADEIAARGGECSHQNIKKLEYGESESVSVKVLEAICAALDISLSDFLSTLEVTN
ncbi:helix-turn-helix transcriptional regulator [Nostoc flagelliforme FACHB-838]|uniref:Helix-turn-helix transcriptional regulator n=1 Tax=Nostoc flagelliforme FACHB-838 TaxID=2692904 RepID=A0ABR8DY98_9NOSO|nr:helix-turn-helix transcriptional regulator [Nostoc flagelliforme]MBD2534188.1 helix-turn-helix transcriptional regulator [Nostoc flagelliforme FACHB-838]